MTVPLDLLLSGGCTTAEAIEHVWHSTLQLPKDKTFVTYSYIYRLYNNKTITINPNLSIGQVSADKAACSLIFKTNKKPFLSYPHE